MRFSQSDDLTFGMELEFQIVNDRTGLLSPSSLEFWDALQQRKDAPRFSLEATLATIELNTSVHSDASEMLEEVIGLTKALTDLATPKNLIIRGGGTQLTQFWNDRIVAPTARGRAIDQKIWIFTQALFNLRYACAHRCIQRRSCNCNGKWIASAGSTVHCHVRRFPVLTDVGYRVLRLASIGAPDLSLRRSHAKTEGLV